MRTFISLIGILLIIFGIVALGYNGFTYTSKEKVMEIGNVQVTADTKKTIYFSPMTGGISLAAGIFLVLIGRIGRKD